MTSRLFALAAVLVASLALGGCDKCGNWVWQSKTCAGQAPK